MSGHNSGPVFTLLCHYFCTLARQGIFAGELDMPPTLSFHTHYILLLIFILTFVTYMNKLVINTPHITLFTMHCIIYSYLKMTLPFKYNLNLLV